MLAKGIIHKSHRAEETTIRLFLVGLSFVTFAGIKDDGGSCSSWYPKPISSWYTGMFQRHLNRSLNGKSEKTPELLKYHGNTNKQQFPAQNLKGRGLSIKTVEGSIPFLESGSDASLVSFLRKQTWRRAVAEQTCAHHSIHGGFWLLVAFTHQDSLSAGYPLGTTLVLSIKDEMAQA